MTPQPMPSPIAFYAQRIIQAFRTQNFPALDAVLKEACRLEALEDSGIEAERTEVFMAVVMELLASRRNESSLPLAAQHAYWRLLSHLSKADKGKTHAAWAAASLEAAETGRIFPRKDPLPGTC